ncbi:unnamed protein product [Cyprideis torosa]|uniref:Uncharacterized protein n=1 Tax=Cyprideis torosa TaxID=163714 RepID=A0A7R8WMM2_9CRUS|nr:unnamed protein product [Cyprideis torosa]CAG0899374.1 unnamed protein product [Cyprideis torosa]
MKRTESPLGLCPHIDTNPITSRKGCFGVVGETVMELPTGTAEKHFDIVAETLITQILVPRKTSSVEGLTYSIPTQSFFRNVVDNFGDHCYPPMKEL